jgi:hypothetical protein
VPKVPKPDEECVRIIYLLIEIANHIVETNLVCVRDDDYGNNIFSNSVGLPTH